MKNLRFVSGLIFGLLLAFFFSIIIKCKADNPDLVQKVPNTFSVINDLSKGTGGNVYKLTIDNIQYIVVEAPNGGVAMVKHQ
jgi:hypothetical protein